LGKFVKYSLTPNHGPEAVEYWGFFNCLEQFWEINPRIVNQQINHLEKNSAYFEI
jgi:hypothetical protein